mgnify:CR=1 FL=1
MTPEQLSQQAEYYFDWTRGVKWCCESLCLDAMPAFYTLTTADSDNPNQLLITTDDKERVQPYSAILKWLFHEGGTDGMCAGREAISALYNVIKLSVKHIPECAQVIRSTEMGSADDKVRVVDLVYYVYESFGKVTTAVGDQLRQNVQALLSTPLKEGSAKDHVMACKDAITRAYVMTSGKGSTKLGLTLQDCFKRFGEAMMSLDRKSTRLNSSHRT